MPPKEKNALLLLSYIQPPQVPTRAAPSDMEHHATVSESP